ncbi:MAG: hypothetical protein ACRDK5_02865 [Solirubrobacterales bacterium]
MREEPVISGAVLKAALVILVAGALGVGAYALVGGGIHIDLPDLPDIDLETTGSETTELEDTTLQDTTVGQSETEPQATDPFTSAGFAAAIEQVKGEVGPGQELTRLFINDVQTQFIVRRGDEIEAYSVRADTGEMTRADATITISGNAKISDFAFALDSVDPAAVDRMLASARKQSGGADFEPTVLSLERAIPFGSRELRWTINAEGGGRNLLYRAAADGSGVENVGGAGTAIPPAAQQAEKLNDCIQAAGQDPNAIFACLDKFN